MCRLCFIYMSFERLPINYIIASIKLNLHSVVFKACFHVKVFL
jgi:hypothetical protein